VIENGTRSQHFMIAVQRMLQLLDEMEEALAEHRWLGCEEYTLADVAFTPYLARLEHLNIFGMVSDRNHVAEWYGRCKARPSFESGIKTWENPSYIALMTRRGGTLARRAEHHGRLEISGMSKCSANLGCVLTNRADRRSAFGEQRAQHVLVLSLPVLAQTTHGAGWRDTWSEIHATSSGPRGGGTVASEQQQ